MNLKQEADRIRLVSVLEEVGFYGARVLAVLATKEELNYSAFSDALIEVNDLKVSRKWT